MTKKQAKEAYRYWADSIDSPTGELNNHAEIMRELYAKAIDNGTYKKLSSDCLQADTEIFNSQFTHYQERAKQ